MIDVKYMDGEQFNKLQKEADAKRAARNRASWYIKDALARYVKEKTRSRSKKAAMEKDAAVKGPRFAKLADYDRREDISEAYGYGCITAGQMDQLEALWDEREELKKHTDESGMYSDAVTECLNSAISHVEGLYEDELAEFDETAVAWRKHLDELEEASRQRQEEYRRWKNGWT
jgi:hypothetical protein